VDEMDAGSPDAVDRQPQDRTKRPNFRGSMHHRLPKSRPSRERHPGERMASCQHIQAAGKATIPRRSSQAGNSTATTPRLSFGRPRRTTAPKARTTRLRSLAVPALSARRSSAPSLVGAASPVGASSPRTACRPHSACARSAAPAAAVMPPSAMQSNASRIALSTEVRENTGSRRTLCGESAEIALTSGHLAVASAPVTRTPLPDEATDARTRACAPSRRPPAIRSARVAGGTALR